jgi:nitrous oxidase accessory protein NosD
MGPYNLTADAVVQNNRIFAAGSSFGITLGGQGLMSATITRNVVEGANVGLDLQRNNATFFGARIFLNDITGSMRPVTITGAYTFPTELSQGGAGNYWGHASPPGFSAVDTNNALIGDQHPFCQPVAANTGPLPPICP